MTPRRTGLALVRDPGRRAGLWYLLLILLGPLRLIYIPDQLFVTDDAPATLHNIAAHQTLFRLGIASDMLIALVLVMVTLAFYRLFAATSRALATLVVIFGGLMPAVLYLTGATLDLGVARLVAGPPFLAAFSAPQQQALAMLLLRLHDWQTTVAETLWGVWLLPLGALVYRSRRLPRWLGVWLGLGGVAYLAMSFTGVLAPQYGGRVFTGGQPFTLAEIALTLWLVIRGAAAPAGRPTVAD